MMSTARVFTEKAQKPYTFFVRILFSNEVVTHV